MENQQELRQQDSHGMPKSEPKMYPPRGLRGEVWAHARPGLSSGQPSQRLLELQPYDSEPRLTLPPLTGPAFGIPPTNTPSSTTGTVPPANTIYTGLPRIGPYRASSGPTFGTHPTNTPSSAVVAFPSFLPANTTAHARTLPEVASFLNPTQLSPHNHVQVSAPGEYPNWGYLQPRVLVPPSPRSGVFPDRPPPLNEHSSPPAASWSSALTPEKPHGFPTADPWSHHYHSSAFFGPLHPYRPESGRSAPSALGSASVSASIGPTFPDHLLLDLHNGQSPTRAPAQEKLSLRPLSRTKLFTSQKSKEVFQNIVKNPESPEATIEYLNRLLELRLDRKATTEPSDRPLRSHTENLQWPPEVNQFLDRRFTALKRVHSAYLHAYRLFCESKGVQPICLDDSWPSLERQLRKPGPGCITRYELIDRCHRLSDLFGRWCAIYQAWGRAAEDDKRSKELEKLQTTPGGASLHQVRPTAVAVKTLVKPAAAVLPSCCPVSVKLFRLATAQLEAGITPLDAPAQPANTNNADLGAEKAVTNVAVVTKPLAKLDEASRIAVNVHDEPKEMEKAADTTFDWDIVERDDAPVHETGPQKQGKCAVM